MGPICTYLSLYNGSKFKIWKHFPTNVPNFDKTEILNELKDTKRNLHMTVYKIKRRDEDKHSIWLYLVATLMLVIIGSVLTILIYYYCKKVSARMSLRLVKISGKTIKTPVYKAVAVYS